MLSTAYFYSKLYYGAAVWLHSGIHASLKNKLWQSSSLMLRIVDGDLNRKKSFAHLHKEYNRASPEMWSNYCTAKAMYSIYNSASLGYISLRASMNELMNRRRKGPVFTRSNKLKIGFNSISNRLQKVSQALELDWTDMSKVAFKTLCKAKFITNAMQSL